MNKYKIYVPSKGRPNISTTPNLLKSENLNFFIVVEPQDYNSYSKYYEEDKLLMLPLNNGGASFVRNFCKEHSISNNESYHWQIDDDITSFNIRENGKKIKSTPLKNILLLESIVDSNPELGLIGMKNDVFAWGRKEPYTQNQQVVTCILVNNKIKSQWREGIIDDTDFSLQTLYQGWTTLLTNRITFDSKPSKSQSGGCTEIYWNDENIKLSRQKKLQELYPNFFEIEYKNNTSRLKPSKIWRIFPKIDLNLP